MKWQCALLLTIICRPEQTVVKKIKIKAKLFIHKKKETVTLTDNQDVWIFLDLEHPYNLFLPSLRCSFIFKYSLFPNLFRTTVTPAELAASVLFFLGIVPTFHLKKGIRIAALHLVKHCFFFKNKSSPVIYPRHWKQRNSSSEEKKLRLKISSLDSQLGIKIRRFHNFRRTIQFKLVIPS